MKSDTRMKMNTDEQRWTQMTDKVYIQTWVDFPDFSDFTLFSPFRSFWRCTTRRVDFGSSNPTPPLVAAGSSSWKMWRTCRWTRSLWCPNMWKIHFSFKDSSLISECDTDDLSFFDGFIYCDFIIFHLWFPAEEFRGLKFLISNLHPLALIFFNPGMSWSPVMNPCVSTSTVKA